MLLLTGKAVHRWWCKLSVIVTSAPLQGHNHYSATGTSNILHMTILKFISISDVSYRAKVNGQYLYLNLVVRLAVINANNAANHLGYDNHVSQVSLDTL